MSLRSYIPGLGEKTTRQKVKKLEQEAGSLPIMFGVFVTKIFENLVVGKFNLALNFVAAAVVVGLLYIYSREIKQKVDSAKDKVEETVSEE